jgi:proteasome lid subunit RPN8/RPN11|tara:strand:- start:8510 stop:9208 length:699 start_codon:yes stop_codon:yes gene_type:complete
VQYLEEIQEHFEKEYPREGCGILAVVKGQKKWFPCTNIAEQGDDFIIDSQEYLKILRTTDITAIVHSHPDVTNEPSDNDIKYCNALGIPYYIFSYPDMELNIVSPKKDLTDLYGRDYKFGEMDCFEALRDYLSEQNIIIPPRAMFEDDWWDKDLDYFTEEIIKDWNHVPVKLEDIQPNDVLIFKLMAKVNNHCGVYIGDDIFYHHAYNRLSCRESLYPVWYKSITGVYRYAT